MVHNLLLTHSDVDNLTLEEEKNDRNPNSSIGYTLYMQYFSVHIRIWKIVIFDKFRLLFYLLTFNLLKF